MFSDIKEVFIDLIKSIPFLLIVIIIVILITFILHRITIYYGYLASFGIIFLLVLSYLLTIYFKTKSIDIIKYKVILIGALIIVSIIISVLTNTNDIMKLFAKYQIREFNVNKIEEQQTISIEKFIFKTQENKDNYINGDIETKIKILKELGFTREEVLNKLENNMNFKKLIKNGNKRFDNLYYQNSSSK